MRNNTAPAEFAQWLGEQHPELYEALFAHAIARGVNSRSRRGLGTLGEDGGYDFSSFSEPVLADVTVDTGNIDYLEGSAIGNAADALPFTIEMSTPAGGTPAGGTSESGSYSSASSGGLGITGALSSVGHWLTSSQGLTSIATLGTAVLGAVATTQVAKAQMAVIQAQAQRAQQGVSPAPISYVQGANGQIVPVYNTGATSQTLPPSLMQAIHNGTAHAVTLPDGSTGYSLTPSTLSSVLSGGNLTWVLLIGGALLLALAVGHRT